MLRRSTAVNMRTDCIAEPEGTVLFMMFQPFFKATGAAIVAVSIYQLPFESGEARS